MSGETKIGIISEKGDSDSGGVILYGQIEDNEFGLPTNVPSCELREGDVVNIVVDPKDTIPIPYSNEVLTNLPSGVWGDKCNTCKYNPYIPRDPKQCTAAKHL